MINIAKYVDEVLKVIITSNELNTIIYNCSLHIA